MSLIKKSSNRKFANLLKASLFTLLEVIAVLSFQLGNSLVFTSIISIVVGLLILICAFRDLKEYGRTPLFLLFISFITFLVFLAIGNFVKDERFLYGKNYLFCLGPVALIFMACSGCIYEFEGKFKLSTVLLIIYSGIALLVLINFASTMIQFCPFYTLIYKGKYFYYNGSPSPVSVDKMAFALYGLSIEEVSIEYYSLFPCLLLTSAVYLPFIKYKEDKLRFCIYLSFTILAFITLLFSINVMSIIGLCFVLVPSIIFMLVFKKIIPNKVSKILKIVFVCLIALGLAFFVVFLFNSQTQMGSEMKDEAFQNFISSNSFLDKIFNSNKFAREYKVILDGVISRNYIDGEYKFYKIYGFSTGPLSNTGITIVETNNFIINSFIYLGFYGFLALLLLLGVGIYCLDRFAKKSIENNADKAVLLSFVFGYFCYSLFNDDMSPAVFNSKLTPMIFSNMFFIVIFLIGVALSKGKKEINYEN